MENNIQVYEFDEQAYRSALLSQYGTMCDLCGCRYSSMLKPAGSQCEDEVVLGRPCCGLVHELPSAEFLNSLSETTNE